MTNDYNYWLDLNGNEKQNKITRFNKLMDKISKSGGDISDILEKVETYNGMIITCPTYVMIDKLPSSFYIRIHVYNLSGDPVANRKVNFNLSPSTNTDVDVAYTDNDGHVLYQSVGLSEGDYTLGIRVDNSNGNTPSYGKSVIIKVQSPNNS